MTQEHDLLERIRRRVTPERAFTGGAPSLVNRVRLRVKETVQKPGWQKIPEPGLLREPEPILPTAENVSFYETGMGEPVRPPETPVRRTFPPGHFAGAEALVQGFEGRGLPVLEIPEPDLGIEPQAMPASTTYVGTGRPAPVPELTSGEGPVDYRLPKRVLDVPRQVTAGLGQGVSTVGMLGGEVLEQVGLPYAGQELAEVAEDVGGLVAGGRYGREIPASPRFTQDPIGWMAYAAGQGLPTTAPALAAGGAGMAIGAARGLDAARKGAAIGSFAAGYLMGVGDTRAQAEEAGWKPSPARTGAVFLTAAPYAALDAILPQRILRSFGGQAEQEAAKGVLRNMLESAALEGGTEGAQSFLTQLSSSLGTGAVDIDIGQIVAEAGAGAVTGGLMGGAAAVAAPQRPQPRQEPPAPMPFSDPQGLIPRAVQEYERAAAGAVEPEPGATGAVGPGLSLVDRVRTRIEQEAEPEPTIGAEELEGLDQGFAIEAPSEAPASPAWAQVSPLAEPLARFTNVDEGMEGRVTQRPDGRFTAMLWDADANEGTGMGFVFPDRGAAEAKAAELAGVPLPSSGEGAQPAGSAPPGAIPDELDSRLAALEESDDETVRNRASGLRGLIDRGEYDVRTIETGVDALERADSSSLVERVAFRAWEETGFEGHPLRHKYADTYAPQSGDQLLRTHRDLMMSNARAQTRGEFADQLGIFRDENAYGDIVSANSPRGMNWRGLRSQIEGRLSAVEHELRKRGIEVPTYTNEELFRDIPRVKAVDDANTEWVRELPGMSDEQLVAEMEAVVPDLLRRDPTAEERFNMLEAEMRREGRDIDVDTLTERLLTADLERSGTRATAPELTVEDGGRRSDLPAQTDFQRETGTTLMGELEQLDFEDARDFTDALVAASQAMDEGSDAFLKLWRTNPRAARAIEEQGFKQRYQTLTGQLRTDQPAVRAVEDDEVAIEDDGPIEEGPFETREEAEMFVDAEVGDPVLASIVETDEGFVVQIVEAATPPPSGPTVRERTDLFGNVIEPTVEQGSLLGAMGQGVTAREQAKLEGGGITAEEMAERATGERVEGAEDVRDMFEEGSTEEAAEAVASDTEPDRGRGSPLTPLADLSGMPSKRRRLSEITPRLYREVSPGALPQYTPDTWVSRDFEELEVFLANTENLARGQGENVGVMLEFDASKLSGIINTRKPGWEFAYQQGEAEIIGQSNKQKRYQDALISVTIRPSASASARDTKLVSMRVLPALERAGWTVEILPDGGSKYTRPDAGPAATRGPSGLADVADSGGRPPPTDREAATVTGSRTLRPISPVEAVSLVGSVIGKDRIFLKNYPSARGMFYPDPLDPRIGLNPALGKDYEQFARTLAHEIGHLIDFLSDRTMAKGNALGRLASLPGYLRSSIDALPTDPSKALTKKDRAKIRRDAERKVGPRPPKDSPGDLSAWQNAVSAEYRQLIIDEMDARGLIGLERVTEELRELSAWWRPWDRTTADEEMIRYRDSSRELYADALSVLLNSPGSLQERAPTFFDAWLAYLERKPEVDAAYNEIQDVLGADPSELYQRRREDIVGDFRPGEEITRAAEDREEPQGFMAYLKQLFVDSKAPVIDAEKKRTKGVPAQAEANAVKMALQEWAHADTVNRLMLMDINRDVHTPLAEAGIDPEDAGQYLMLVRIRDGDRGGMAVEAQEAIKDLTGEESWEAARAAYVAIGEEEAAAEEEGGEGGDFDPELLSIADSGILNPKGYTPAEASEQLDGLRESLGDERYAELEHRMELLREIVFRTVEEGVRLGVISKKVYDERILPNRETYAPYAVIDYYTGRVSAGIRRQIGTVKGIANPYTTAILKAMSANRLNELQKAKLAVLDALDTDFPGQGKEQRIDKYNREKRPGPNKGNLVYHVDGKLRYREVDKYIARVFEVSDLGALDRLAKTLSSKVYGIFHPLYVSWSLAWQTRNIQRDWKRTYKNLAAAHAGQPSYRQALEAVLDLGRLAVAYKDVASSAWAHARRRDNALIREMLADRALGRAFHSFEANPDAMTHERLLQRYGIVDPAHPGLKGFFEWLGTPVETMGVFQETLSKAAAYRMLGDLGVTDRERAYIVRNYTGTPDSTVRGLASEMTNGIYMYANVIMAGLRADAEVAFQPQTAAGYWMRSVVIDFMPKMAMAAALGGWLGEELEDFFSGVPSYDLEKYIIVPLGWSDTERGARKPIYLRLPHDDANRILAATSWALMMGSRPYAPSHAMGILQGEFPGVNPALDIPKKWVQMLGGRNPYDSFRQREIIPRTEWEAGGWDRARETLRWSMGQFGVISQFLGLWLYANTQDPLDVTDLEEALRSIPAQVTGLATLIKVSDRGYDENAYWEIDAERQIRAQLRADFSDAVRSALRERDRLNRFGVERLDAVRQRRREQLNNWYRAHYRHLTADAEDARDRDDDDSYRRALEELDASLRRPAPSSQTRGRSGSRSRPNRPSRPER